MAELPQRSSRSPSRGRSGATWWYCEIGESEHGPMDFRELRTLALERKLLGHHQVWRSDRQERQGAGTIVGLIPAARTKAENPPPSDLGDDDPYATPKTRTIADGPPGGLYLPHLRPANFPIFFLVLLLSSGVAIAGWLNPDSDTAIIFYSLAGFGFLFWIFLAVTYLYRAWEMMHMFGAQLTGGKAIRLLFFPFFNALWCFVALFGWSKLWNHSVKHHPGLGPAHPVWRPLFFLFPVLFLISQTLLLMYFIINEWPIDPGNQSHQISMSFLGLTIVVGMACWFQLTHSINFLARKKS